MTDHWQGRPATGDAPPGPDPAAAAALETVTAAADVAVKDDQFRKTVGARLAAALAVVLRGAETVQAPHQRAALVRLSHVMLNMAARPPHCDEHELRQHRDNRPAWCRKCGRDRFGAVQRPERP